MQHDLNITNDAAIIIAAAIIAPRPNAMRVPRSRLVGVRLRFCLLLW